MVEVASGVGTSCGVVRRVLQSVEKRTRTVPPGFTLVLFVVPYLHGRQDNCTNTEVQLEYPICGPTQGL